MELITLKMGLPFSLINEEVGIEGTGYAAHNFENTLPGNQ